MANEAWLIPAIPLLVYVILLVAGRRISEPVVAGISVSAVLLAFLLAIAVLADVAVNGPTAPTTYAWLDFGAHTLTVGYEVTMLNALMLVVVTLVSALVLLFSRSYMKGDERFSRFYQYLNLFVFSMLGLVISPNLLQFYIFWELVGVCSYLLVGFWYYKPEAAAAAKKAFIVTRIGDVGLFIGIILLYIATGTFDFNGLYTAGGAAFSQVATLAYHGASVPFGMSSSGFITLTALLVFIGAVGKSAQFPLHVWLPDAMEGPTPVSALIHAATMVAAGVYLVARMQPLFAASPVASETVAVIGGITALLAASIGLTQRDIKRVIAYSTVSQLGYMMMALGVGAYTAGIFHLMTHAFFKALLFLTAGSVIHALDTQDLFSMGGLRKKMPITHIAFLAGALALAGVPPFAGFWSKDEILSAAFQSGHYVLYAIGLLAAFFTAFYIFRVYFLVFWGEAKGEKHAHEGGSAMVIPLLVLGALATLSGFLNTPFDPFVTRFLTYGHPLGIGIDPPASLPLILVSVVIALLGIWLAYSVYGRANRGAELAKRMGVLYTLSYNKFYIDEIYHYLIVTPIFTIARAIAFIDRFIIDGIVRMLGELGYTGGVTLKYANTGQVQTYGVLTLFGLVALVAIALGIGGVL